MLPAGITPTDQSAYLIGDSLDGIQSLAGHQADGAAAESLEAALGVVDRQAGQAANEHVEDLPGGFSEAGLAGGDEAAIQAELFSFPW